jgi:membrane-anchored protein YejM (alkaline phosphatase superfamily)
MSLSDFHLHISNFVWQLLVGGGVILGLSLITLYLRDRALR